MEIRKATMWDLPALRELYRALEGDAVGYQPEHFIIGTRDDRFFLDIIERPGQDIWSRMTAGRWSGLSMS